MGGVRAAALVALLSGGVLAASPAPASAQTPLGTRAPLKPYAVTIRRFDPAKGPESGEDFVLPVDSPDEEHAVSSTMANAVSFTRKWQDGRALPVAFLCVRVEPR